MSDLSDKLLRLAGEVTYSYQVPLAALVDVVEAAGESRKAWNMVEHARVVTFLDAERLQVQALRTNSALGKALDALREQMEKKNTDSTPEPDNTGDDE